MTDKERFDRLVQVVEAHERAIEAILNVGGQRDDPSRALEIYRAQMKTKELLQGLRRK